MSQIGPKGEKICSEKEILDGHMDGRMDGWKDEWTEGWMDRLITIGHPEWDPNYSPNKDITQW